jgi:hypothetical protein
MAEEEFGRRLLFDFFIHEAENIHNRVDWFLIFHGILFEAFLSTHYAVHRITLGTLGCLVSYVWLVAGVRQLWDVRQLVESVKDRNIMGAAAADLFKGMYKARAECQPRWIRWARATPAFCILLPFAVLVAWLAVTTTYADSGARFSALEIIGLAIALLTVAWAFLRGPTPSAEAIALLRDKNTSQEDGKDRGK